MILEKNKNYMLEITAQGVNGEGIGKLDGFTIFVENTVEGDTVEIKIVKLKKNYAYGKLIKIIKPSKFRKNPECPIFEKCGGCNLQHMTYEKQLEYKTKKVRDNLERIGGFKGIYVNDTIGMEKPYAYRNKAQYPVGYDKGEVIMGFFAPRSHRIVKTEDCFIQNPVNKEILDKVKEYMSENNVQPYDEKNHMGIVRHVLTRVGFVTGEIMVCLVINSENIPKKERLIEKLLEIKNIKSIVLNINKEKTNVILGSKIKVLYGNEYITDYIGDVCFEISPLSFFQVNPIQTKVLYETALSYAELDGNEIVIDAYCGIGTISLFLAKSAKKVYGVEIVPEAIEDAKKNALKNNISNVEFIVGKSEEIIPSLYEERGVKADVVVVDPPRKGCDERLLAVIAQMQPKRIVYVSCDSATLARDLKFMDEKDIRL